MRLRRTNHYGLDLPRIDSRPRRALTSLNLRRREKAVFDHLHSWWSLRRGQPVSQADAFSILLTLALQNEEADLPPELVARRRG